MVFISLLCIHETHIWVMTTLGGTHSVYTRGPQRKPLIASDSWFIVQTSLLLLGFFPTICQLSLHCVICHSPLHSSSHSFVDMFYLLSSPLLSFVLFFLTFYGHFSGVLQGNKINAGVGFVSVPGFP